MNDMLSQEEIDSLLGGTDTDDNNYEFTDMEKDTIGEVGNISMGTAATTLSTLLGQKVTITTPTVTVLSLEELSNQHPLPFVAVDVKYKEGLEGTNLLILKGDDVKIITDLMMGGSGQITEEPLTELHLSAIGEAMNQMVGSSSTSLSEIFNKKIDITPPVAFNLDLSEDSLMQYFPNKNEILVKVSFEMIIGDLIDSEIMQLIPIEFAKDIVGELLGEVTDSIEETKSKAEEKKTEPIIEPQSSMAASTEQNVNQTISNDNPVETMQERPRSQEQINIQPVQFQSFDQPSVKGIPENISLIQDVPLKVTVQLGRTVKKISEILEFGPGTIVELDTLVGEPLDILVNGQYVAKGEVVVIDENYGIRVTDIVNPVKRFSKVYD